MKFFHSEYNKGMLREILCLLFLENYKSEKTLMDNFLVNCSFIKNSRSYSILMNILSAYYYITNNYEKATLYCNKHKICFTQLGASYNHIYQNNYKIIQSEIKTNLSPQ